MGQIPNLLYGRGEGTLGALGPNLDTLTTVAKLGFRTALEQMSDKIEITDIIKNDARYSGFLDDFSFKDNGSIDDYRYRKTFDAGLCDYHVDVGAGLDYDLDIATKGLAKSVILPLIDGIEYLSNSTSQPDDDGKAVETIKYQINSVLNLNKLKTDLTLAGDGGAGLGLKGGGLCPNFPGNFSFNIPTTTYPITLPDSHPFSLDLTLELPSYDNIESINKKSHNLHRSS